MDTGICPGTLRALRSSQSMCIYLALTNTQITHFGFQIRTLSSRLIDPVNQIISCLFRYLEASKMPHI